MIVIKNNRTRDVCVALRLRVFEKHFTCVRVRVRQMLAAMLAARLDVVVCARCIVLSSDAYLLLDAMYACNAAAVASHASTSHIFVIHISMPACR